MQHVRRTHSGSSSKPITASCGAITVRDEQPSVQHSADDMHMRHFLRRPQTAPPRPRAPPSAPPSPRSTASPPPPPPHVSSPPHPMLPPTTFTLRPVALQPSCKTTQTSSHLWSTSHGSASRRISPAQGVPSSDQRAPLSGTPARSGRSHPPLHCCPRRTAITLQST